MPSASHRRSSPRNDARSHRRHSPFAIDVEKKRHVLLAHRHTFLHRPVPDPPLVVRLELQEHVLLPLRSGRSVPSYPKELGTLAPPQAFGVQVHGRVVKVHGRDGRGEGRGPETIATRRLVSVIRLAVCAAAYNTKSTGVECESAKMATNFSPRGQRESTMNNFERGRRKAMGASDPTRWGSKRDCRPSVLGRDPRSGRGAEPPRRARPSRGVMDAGGCSLVPGRKRPARFRSPEGR